MDLSTFGYRLTSLHKSAIPSSGARFLLRQIGTGHQRKVRQSWDQPRHPFCLIIEWILELKETECVKVMQKGANIVP